MTTTTRNNLSIAAIALSLFAFWAVTANAYEIEQIPGGDQVVGDFVVGPGKIELTVEPGQEKMTEIIVTNRMGETRQFSFDIEDVRGSTNPEETVVLLGAERGPYSLRDYISIPEMTFELAQGERARIPVTVRVPADAEPGGLYGTVLVTTTSRPADAGGDENVRGGAVIVSRIGTLFFVTVPGEVKHDGRLAEFSTLPKQTYFTEGPIRFQLLFENKGSMHLNPYGDVRITNIFGQEVAHIVADPWFALPGSLRFRELSWDRTHLFGYYTAEARVNRGYNDEVDTMRVSFLVVPWQLILGTFVGIFIVIFLLRLIGKNFQIKRRTE